MNPRSDSIIALFLVDFLLVLGALVVATIDAEVRGLAVAFGLVANIPCYLEWKRIRDSDYNDFRSLLKFTGGLFFVVGAFFAVDVVLAQANLLKKEGWYQLFHTGGFGFPLTVIIAGSGIFIVAASVMRLCVQAIRQNLSKQRGAKS